MKLGSCYIKVFFCLGGKREENLVFLGVLMDRGWFGDYWVVWVGDRWGGVFWGWLWILFYIEMIYFFFMF